METMTQRKRRSVALTKDELKAFVKVYNAFPTKTDAAEAFDLSYQVLDLVVLRGSGAPETIQKIKDVVVQRA